MQVDVTNYTEIATHNVEDRRVLDLAVDQLDNSLAVITRETENFNQQARIYDIGRVRYPVQSCKPHTRKIPEKGSIIKTVTVSTISNSMILSAILICSCLSNICFLQGALICIRRLAALGRQ